MMLLVSVGALLRRTLFVAEPSVWPPPAWKLTVAPALRVRPWMVTVRPAFPPVVVIVEVPELALIGPRDGAEATVALPVTLRVPPLRLTVTPGLRRLLLLAALLSQVRVPPVFSVTALLDAMV